MAKRSAEVPDYRAFFAAVVRVERTSPSYVRITFGGDDLAAFGHAGVDQRVKVLRAQPGRTLADLPTGDDWYLTWRAMPAQIRPLMRTYTVRAYRPDVREIDIDFVLHGDDGDEAGPMSSWAAGAQLGDEVALLGPDRPGQGAMWGAAWSLPEDASQVLLAGDETALPAIGSILESLPPNLRVIVCAELPKSADVPDWELPAGAEARWLVRLGDEGPIERGGALAESVRQALALMCTPDAVQAESEGEESADDEALLWDVPEVEHAAAGTYVWMAGEADVMKQLRRIARSDFALPRSAVACMGYWRRGAAEAA